MLTMTIKHTPENILADLALLGTLNRKVTTKLRDITGMSGPLGDEQMQTCIDVNTKIGNDVRRRYIQLEAFFSSTWKLIDRLNYPKEFHLLMTYTIPGIIQHEMSLDLKQVKIALFHKMQQYNDWLDEHRNY